MSELQPYIGHLINSAVVLVGVITVMVRKFNAQGARLAAIELRLKMEDDNRADRRHAERLEIDDIATTAARGVCARECPRRTPGEPTNPSGLAVVQREGNT